MNGPSRAPAAVATLRATPDGVSVDGTVDRRNAASIATELLEVLGSDRSRAVVDLSRVVFADCGGVRIVREALSSLDGSGVPLEIRTSDPVARVSFDLRRVA
jgi:anti-anti-sigma regulatory factor